MNEQLSVCVRALACIATLVTVNGTQVLGAVYWGAAVNCRNKILGSGQSAVKIGRVGYLLLMIMAPGVAKSQPFSDGGDANYTLRPPANATGEVIIRYECYEVPDNIIIAEPTFAIPIWESGCVSGPGSARVNVGNVGSFLLQIRECDPESEWNITIDWELLQVCSPNLDSPRGSSGGNSSTIDFRLRNPPNCPSTGGLEWEIEIYEESIQPANLFRRLTTKNTTGNNVAGFQYEGEDYVWRARARLDAGSPWSGYTTQTFQNGGPPVPIDLTPNDIRLDRDSVNLTWSVGDGPRAHGFEVVAFHVNDDGSLTKFMEWSPHGNDSTSVPLQLNRDGRKIVWEVYGYNYAGDGPVQKAFFIDGPPPNHPTYSDSNYPDRAAVSPGPLQFSWTNADTGGKVRYAEVQIARDKDFEQIVASSRTVIGEGDLTSGTIESAAANPQDGSALFWRVIVGNDAGVAPGKPPFRRYYSGTLDLERYSMEIVSRHGINSSVASSHAQRIKAACADGATVVWLKVSVPGGDSDPLSGVGQGDGRLLSVFGNPKLQQISPRKNGNDWYFELLVPEFHELQRPDSNDSEQSQTDLPILPGVNGSILSDTHVAFLMVLGRQELDGAWVAESVREESVPLFNSPVLLLPGIFDSPRDLEGLQAEIETGSGWDGNDIGVDLVELSNLDLTTKLRSMARNKNLVADEVEDQLELLRLHGVAVEKVDIVASGVAGLWTRIYIEGIEPPGLINAVTTGYREPYRGDIRRLITVETPHFGSEAWGFVHDFLEVEHRLSGTRSSDDFIVNVSRKAPGVSGFAMMVVRAIVLDTLRSQFVFDDLTPDSDFSRELSRRNAFLFLVSLPVQRNSNHDVLVHAVISYGGADYGHLDELELPDGKRGWLSFAYDVLGLNDSYFDNNDHNFSTSTISQRGGLRAEYVTPHVIVPGSVAPLEDPGILTEIRKLLAGDAGKFDSVGFGRSPYIAKGLEIGATPRPMMGGVLKNDAPNSADIQDALLGRAHANPSHDNNNDTRVDVADILSALQNEIADGAISLELSQEYDEFRGGQIVECAVAGTGTVVPEYLASDDDSVLLDGSKSTVASITISEDAIGAYPLVALGRDAEGRWAVGRIWVQVGTDAVLEEIFLDDGATMDIEVGEEFLLPLRGYFSDGIRRELFSTSTGTVYYPEDPQVVEVGSDGVITGVGLGATNIVVQNSTFSLTHPVTVTLGKPIITDSDASRTGPSLHLTWAPVPGASSYRIHYDDDAYVPFDAIPTGVENIASGTDVGDVTEFQLEGLAESQRYYFSIQAVHEGHVSKLSERMRAFVGGNGWLEETDSAPWLERTGHQVVAYDGWLWLLGGINRYGEYMNDVYRSQNGVQWELVTDDAAWSPRAGHRVVVFNEEMVLTAGYSDESRTQQYSNFDRTWSRDVWVSSDGENWTQKSVSGANWAARRDHGLVVHNGMLYMLGGLSETGPLNDVIASADGASWVSVNPSANWEPRFNHSVVSFEGGIWVFGGSESAAGEIWTSDDSGVSWQSQNAGWGTREDFSVVETGGDLLLLGGNEDGGDVWRYSPVYGWELDLDSAPWGGRTGAGTVVFGGRIWVIAGQDGDETRLNDVWTFDLPPIVRFDSPSRDTQIPSSVTNFSFSGSAEDSVPIVRVEWRVNDGLWYLAEGTETWEFDTGTRLVVGNNRVDVRAFNAEGESSATRFIRIVRGDLDVSLIHPLKNPGFERLLPDQTVPESWDFANNIELMPCEEFTSIGMHTAGSNSHQHIELSHDLIDLIDSENLRVRFGGTVGRADGFGELASLRLTLHSYDEQDIDQLGLANDRIDFRVPEVCTTLLSDSMPVPAGTRFMIYRLAADGQQPYLLDNALVELVQIDPNTPPALEFSVPSRPTRLVPDDVVVSMVSGIATDIDGDIAEVHVRINGSEWRLAEGTGEWQAEISLEPWDNVIEVRALDSGGQFSPIATRNISRFGGEDAPALRPLRNPDFELPESAAGTVPDYWDLPNNRVPMPCDENTSLGMVTAGSNTHQHVTIPGELLPWIELGIMKARFGGTIAKEPTQGSGESASLRLTFYEAYEEDIDNPGLGVNRIEFDVPSDCIDVESEEIIVPANARFLTYRLFLDGGQPYALDDAILEFSLIENLPPIVGAPENEITVPLNQTTASVSGEAFDIDGEIVGVEYRIADGPWMTATGTSNWSLDVPLDVGDTNIEVRAQDNEGHYSDDYGSLFLTVTRGEVVAMPLLNADFENLIPGRQVPTDWDLANNVVTMPCDDNSSRGLVTSGFYENSHQHVQLPPDLEALADSGGLVVRFGGTVVKEPTQGFGEPASLRLRFYSDNQQDIDDPGLGGENISFVVPQTCEQLQSNLIPVPPGTRFMIYRLAVDGRQPYVLDNAVLEIIKTTD